MGSLQDGETVAMAGVFTYAGTVECDIRIVRSSVRYGSGDCDDPPEIQNDQMCETFYVQFGSTTERGRFNAGSGSYSSLAAAMDAACTTPGIGSTIVWAEPTP